MYEAVIKAYGEAEFPGSFHLKTRICILFNKKNHEITHLFVLDMKDYRAFM